MKNLIAILLLAFSLQPLLARDDTSRGHPNLSQVQLDKGDQRRPKLDKGDQRRNPDKTNQIIVILRTLIFGN